MTMSALSGPTLHKMVDQFLTNYWTPNNIFISVLIFSWIIFIWDLYLSSRQYKIYKSVAEVPSELIGVLDNDTLMKARDYNIDKTRFGFYASIWNQLLSTIILWFEAIPLLWRYSGRVIDKFGYGTDCEIFQTLMFVLIGSVISTIIDLPWSLYNTFVIEEKHGFNKQTAGFYAKDKLKKFVIMQAILAPILSAAIWIVKIGGDFFFVYLWAFCFVVTILLMTVYADWIAPLFDKFTPLPDGELKQQIEKLAASIDFPLKKLFVVEGSKRSSHSNAYFYGFHKNKRIVLFDTLIEDFHKKKESEEKESEEKEESGDKPEKKEHKKVGCNNDEILAVLAHELGHWKLNHILKNLVIAQINLLLCFSVFALLYKNQVLYDAFGFLKIQPVFIGIFIIFQYIFSPYNEILSFLMTCLGRRFEFDADAFAKHLNRAADLRSALIKLNKDNLGFPLYDWLYSSWYHSHPPLLERIRALGKID